MKQIQNKKLTQKSVYLAVVLAMQSLNVMAEEPAPVVIAPTQELEEVNVKATVQPTTDGYQATKTRVGKVLEDPQDIPQAITTVTNELMHDQQVGSLREALRNVSGLTF